MKKAKIKKHLSPIQVITIGFLLIVLLGTLLLYLPISAKAGRTTGFLDALFTATSATCITGLTTIDTAIHWSVFGKVVIMCLIEIGGLGFMSVTVFLFLMARKKINLRMRLVIREALNLENINGVFRLMIYAVNLTVLIQAVGALLLMFDFIPRFGFAKGFFYSIFYSISAFCNAGFDLFGNSLEDFGHNSYVLLVMSALIIAGGLGFMVWRDLFTHKKGERLMLHTKLALMVSGALLVSGFFVFLITEKNMAIMHDMNWWNRLVNTLFLSVSPRTAGYYTMSYGYMSQAGLIFTMFLMFIGGTSGSTAGGFKTTTFGVLVLQVWSTLRGRDYAEFQERSINPKIILRAFTLFFVTITMIVISIMILSMTETIPKGHGIEYIAFEVFSAFGTTGATLGLTNHLTIIGKIVIIFLMFMGRVGAFTFILALMNRDGKVNVKIKYPEENVMIG